jgi:serine phosphatase RsbU (regulator of sigma subunit)
VLFSTVGYFDDLMNGGWLPYSVVASDAVVSGLTATIWVLVISRLPRYCIPGLIAMQFVIPPLASRLDHFLAHRFPAAPATPAGGIHLSAWGMLASIIVSYILFISFISGQGKESFKLRNELDLAHGIQKTLVPPISLQTARFEIYGVSYPSEKVGGDLVDALCLPGGDAIAYLADIAGHGLQAGILMGMLKTATRTALLEAGERDAAQTLPVLLERLNTVLPEVKEPHMYATFTGLRLCADGGVFYSLAASPPLLHWHAGSRELSHLEEEQFPLGLLPVSGFGTERLQTTPGDLLLVATDGILEACNKKEEEFGLDRLKHAIEGSAGAPLAEMAGSILEVVRAFGKQADDQTILIVRRL